MAHLGPVTYAPGAKYTFPRNYVRFFALSWVSDFFLVSGGNPFVWQTNVYGGIRLYLRFTDEFYAASSNLYSLDYIIEDYYALAPPYTTPISPGAHAVRFGVSTTPIQPTFAIEQPYLQKHTYYALPTSLTDPWVVYPPYPS